MHIVILGASKNKERYSYLVQKELMEDPTVSITPINPNEKEILGVACIKSISLISEPIHTLTIYLSPKWLVPLIPKIVSKKMQRVIFNPGTENKELQNTLTTNNIPWIEACSLVLIKTNQFFRA